MKILLNISNHPSSRWEEEQKEGWDKIIDIPFPNVAPHIEANSKEFQDLVQDLVTRLKEIYDDNGSQISIMLQGEFSLCYALLKRLLYDGYFISLAIPTTERVAKEVINQDGSVTKSTTFKFVRWRLILF